MLFELYCYILIIQKFLHTFFKANFQQYYRKKITIFRGILRTDSFFDKYVFKKIRDQVGGRIKLMTLGSAPTAPDVLAFARAAFGCIIIEGYGLIISLHF